MNQLTGSSSPLDSSNVNSVSSKLTHNHILPLHSSSTFENSNGIRIEFNGDYSILSIANVQVSHAGNYTCTVSNEASSISYSSFLSVNGKFKRKKNKIITLNVKKFIVIFIVTKLLDKNLFTTNVQVVLKFTLISLT